MIHEYSTNVRTRSIILPSLKMHAVSPLIRASVLNRQRVDQDMAPEPMAAPAPRLQTLLDFFAGKFSRRVLVRRLMPVMFLCLFACLLMADLLFPRSSDGGPGYIPFTRTISGQGNHGDNPQGAWFFTAGLISTAISMLPCASFTWRRLSVICKGMAGFILVLMLAGAVGFAMVGIFDEEYTCIALDAAGKCLLVSHQIHDVAADIAFLGNLFAVLFALFPMIAAKRRAGKDRFGITWQVVHILSFIALIVVGLILNKNPAVPALFRQFAFWQWSVFLGLVIYYVSLAIRFPSE
jgi:hypothetical membrane protein